MEGHNVAFEVKLSDTYEAAVEKVVGALKENGFGVLTQVDVKATLKEKINEDFHPYLIMGVCNPKLAHRAIDSDPLMGLFLPCKVTVEEVDGGSLVRVLDPNFMVQMPQFVDNPVLIDVAKKAGQLLKNAADSLK